MVVSVGRNAGHEELQNQRLAPLRWLCGTGDRGPGFNFRHPCGNTEPRRIFLVGISGAARHRHTPDTQRKPFWICRIFQLYEISFDLM